MNSSVNDPREGGGDVLVENKVDLELLRLASREV